MDSDLDSPLCERMDSDEIECRKHSGVAPADLAGGANIGINAQFFLSFSLSSLRRNGNELNFAPILGSRRGVILLRCVFRGALLPAKPNTF